MKTELGKARQCSPRNRGLTVGKIPGAIRYSEMTKTFLWKYWRLWGGVFPPVRWNATLPMRQGDDPAKPAPSPQTRQSRTCRDKGTFIVIVGQSRARSRCLTNTFWILTSRDTYPTEAEISRVLSLARWISSNTLVLFNNLFDLLLQQFQPQGWTFLILFF